MSHIWPVIFCRHQSLYQLLRSPCGSAVDGTCYLFLQHPKMVLITAIRSNGHSPFCRGPGSRLIRRQSYLAIAKRTSYSSENAERANDLAYKKRTSSDTLIGETKITRLWKWGEWRPESIMMKKRMPWVKERTVLQENKT